MEEKRRKKTYLLLLFVLPVVLITLLFLVFMITNSFMGREEIIKHYQGAFSADANSVYTWIRLIPDRITGSQYVDGLYRSCEFWYYFWNSVILAVPSLVGIVIVAVLGGYGFARFEFRGRKFLLTLFIVLMMIPYQVMLTPNLIVLDKLGLVGTRASVICLNIFTPLGTYLMYQFMKGISIEQIEAARCDGAGEIAIFLRIVLPQVKNGIASLIILNFIDMWNMVEQVMVFIKTEVKYPLSVALIRLQNADVGISFVYGIVYAFPLIIVFLLCKDYLISGIEKMVVGSK